MRCRSLAVDCRISPLCHLVFFFAMRFATSLVQLLPSCATHSVTVHLSKMPLAPLDVTVSYSSLETAGVTTLLYVSAKYVDS